MRSQHKASPPSPSNWQLFVPVSQCCTSARLARQFWGAGRLGRCHCVHLEGTGCVVAGTDARCCVARVRFLSHCVLCVSCMVVLICVQAAAGHLQKRLASSA